jgi:hypothetical protein
MPIKKPMPQPPPPDIEHAPPRDQPLERERSLRVVREAVLREREPEGGETKATTGAPKRSPKARAKEKAGAGQKIAQYRKRQQAARRVAAASLGETTAQPPAQ